MSIKEKEPTLNILFLDKNIIDPNEIYMTDIYRLPLTTGLSVIGYKVFGKFLPIFQILHFFGFHSKKCPLKMNASQNKIFEFWRKQITPMNQACNRVYSDKVSKIWIFGPISNFARCLQAAPLKLSGNDKLALSEAQYST